MKQLLLSVAAITAFSLSTPARAQGVPTFDGSQLGQLVAQLEHMAEDLNVQLQQLATMRLELETQTRVRSKRCHKFKKKKMESLPFCFFLSPPPVPTPMTQGVWDRR